MQGFAIAGRPIGPGHPPYLIAELSGNHNGRLERALALVDAAAEAGADAVKLQTYTADTITLDVDRPEFRIHGGPWDGRHLHELYREAATPWEWHPALFERARARGLHCFSSPFDPTAVAFLSGLDVPAWKIASFEIVDLPLIAEVAATGRPVIVSTGVGDLGEIEAAVRVVRAAGAPVALLHCVSAYPAPAEEMRLGTVAMLAAAFGCPVGLSDHSAGTAAAVAAVALGAGIVEKHLTLARADGGPDAAFSLEPEEFARLVADCRMAHAALGPALSDRSGIGGANAQFRRALRVVADVPAGTVLTGAHVRSLRPGGGLAPRHLGAVLGRRAARDLVRGEPLGWDMLETGAPED